MRAGRLRKRVSIDQPTRVADAHGQPIVTWREIAQAWAEIVPVSADETKLAQVVQGEVTHRITMRHTPDLPGPECRIRWNSRTFQVMSRLNYMEIGRELDVMCKELV